jgi:DNA primase large subunit
MNLIDFDKSSLEWRKNKKYLGNGLFTYLCNYIHSTGKQCNKPISSLSKYNICTYFYNNTISNNYINHPNKYYFCKRHLHRKKNELNYVDAEDDNEKSRIS